MKKAGVVLLVLTSLFCSGCDIIKPLPPDSVITLQHRYIELDEDIIAHENGQQVLTSEEWLERAKIHRDLLKYTLEAMNAEVPSVTPTEVEE